MSARRRALMVTLDFPPSHGGIQSMARRLVEGARCTDFTVLAPQQEGARAFDHGLQVPVVRVPGLGSAPRGFVLTMTPAALAASVRLKPDVVVAMHVLAAPAGVVARAPTVVVCHGGELRSPRIRAAARLLLPRVAHVVCNSNFTRAAALALGALPDRTSVIRVGAPDPVVVAPEEIEAVRAQSGGGRLVLSVGRLEPHKGHDVLIGAVARLAPDVRLVVVGDGPDRPRLDAVARGAGVAQRLLFAGRVPDERLAAYYAAADAFALCSRATGAGVEGGGIVLLEASAYGLPIVAAASGGIPETIRDGENGLLVDSLDENAIAAALARVLQDDVLARRLGESARTIATTERSWTAFVEQFEAVLESSGRVGSAR